MEKEFTLEAQDITAACQAIKQEYASAGKCCPVFQCLRRHGIRVGTVAIKTAWLDGDRFGFFAPENRAYLDNRAQRITALNPRNWAAIESPVTFAVEFNEGPNEAQ